MTSALDQRGRNRLLGVLFTGVLMAALDIAVVGPALPAIQRSFGVDAGALSWIFSIYVLTNLIGTPICAKLSDRFGRRTVYVACVALFALGSLLVALAPHYGLLLAGRAVQGFGAGGIFPVATAVIGDSFPLEQRGKALGLIGAVFGIAFLLGPILGGVLLFVASWHWLFFVNLPLAALVIALALRVVPQTTPAERKRWDVGGIVLLSAALASLAYGLTMLKDGLAGLGSLTVWPFLLLPVLICPLLLAVERRAADPLLNLGLFRSRQVAIISAVAFGAGVAEAAIVFVPVLLVLAFGVSSSTASFMLLPVVLAMAFGSPLAGRMLDRSGSRVVVLLGCVLIAVGLGLAGVFQPPSYVSFYTAATIFGLGLSVLLGASLRYVMLNETLPSERAAAQSVLTILMNIGQLIGGVLVGVVAAALGGGVAGYADAFLVVAALMAGLTLLALGLKGRAAELETVRRLNGIALR